VSRRSTHAARSRWWSHLWSVQVRVLLAFGVVAVVGTAGTYAFWTDSVPISGTTFTAGTIDLRVNNLDTVSGYTTLNLAAMVPGNTVAGVLTIKNNGTAPLKYTATTTASNADGKGLGAALTVKVTGDAAVTGTSPAATCAGTALAGTGTTLGGGLVSTGRLLAAGSSETLCVQVTLPATAPSALQGATTNVAFTFAGTSDLS
jgi:predicted ribosomally synthesized peptide with SipW-like signal peptide